MRLLIFGIAFTLVFFQAHCQFIKGKVIDSKSGEPLKYVSIGIIDTPCGTITDESGNFSMEIKKQSPKAMVRFSMIGYTSKTFMVEEMSLAEKVVRLDNKPIQLAEVVIRKGKLKKVGTTGYSRHRGFCGWGGSYFGKGYEIGIKIELGPVPVKLRTLHMNVYKVSFDTALFRLHIRKITNGLPQNELLTTNILIAITAKEGWLELDLNKYNLLFRDDVALSIEWVKAIQPIRERYMKVNSSKQELPVMGFTLKKNKGCTFTKWGTEAKWTRLDSESPSFYLTVQE